jgi:hypothetical protein
MHNQHIMQIKTKRASYISTPESTYVEYDAGCYDCNRLWFAPTRGVAPISFAPFISHLKQNPGVTEIRRAGRRQRTKARQVLAAQLTSGRLGYIGAVFGKPDAVARHGILDGRHGNVRASGVSAGDDLLFRDDKWIAPFAGSRHADRVFRHPPALGAAELDADWSVRHAEISLCRGRALIAQAFVQRPTLLSYKFFLAVIFCCVARALCWSTGPDRFRHPERKFASPEALNFLFKNQFVIPTRLQHPSWSPGQILLRHTA